MPERDPVPDLEAADRFLASDQTILEVVRILHENGFPETAANLLEMSRQRLAGDYLQPSAIFNQEFQVQSAINDPNTYTGPGTGYRLSQNG
jgi:propanediol dehydratase large subunit